VLTKDLLRVSRAGGGYHPQFADRGGDDEALAGRVLGVFQGHVGEERGALRDALRDLEGEADDFKLVRGFAHLVERDAGFEVRAPVDPERARRAAFDAAEDVAGGVVHEDEREAALAEAAARFPGDVSPAALADALYADRETREVLVEVPERWTPGSLVAQYNLSLAQTALFDATEVRVRCSDPRRLVSVVKRLGLLYEVVPTDDGREVVLTGPDAVFRHTRRYGTRFARVLRSVAATGEWRVEATVDDRGTQRQLVLTDDDLAVPDADPVTEVSFDSGVEREFAQRFDGLDLDWDLVREPDVLAAGERLMVPDFAFEYVHGDARVYFEIMGFWTPEYVEKKLGQLAETDETLLVAVDQSLGVGEEVAARDHRVVEYTGSVRVKDVVDALRDLEADLVAEQASGLPAELAPDDDAVTLAALAARYAVSEQAIEDVDFPEHERVGRTLVRPAVLDAIDADLEAGLSKDDAEAVVADHGVDDASAVFSRLGYRVDWDGLSGGTLREQ
jgi:predicted nuclease of restriction endonuclease-like RecB superfamily